MAFTRVQSIHGTNSTFSNVTTATATFASPVTSGNTVICVFQNDNGSSGAISSIQDDKGNVYPVLDNTLDTDDNQRAVNAYLQNVTGGPTVFTVNISPASGFTELLIEEWSGLGAIAGHTSFFNSSKSTTADAMTSGSITPSTNGCLIWGSLVNTSGAVNATHGSGFTLGFDSADSSQMITENLVQTTAASIAATFTSPSAAEYVGFVMAFAPPTATVLMPLSFFDYRPPSIGIQGY